MKLLVLRHRGSYTRLWHVDTRGTVAGSCHNVSSFGDTACMSFQIVRLAPASFSGMRRDSERKEDSGEVEDKAQVN